ncbi:MAG: O-antigen ligase family protein [Hyphomonas sp.]
MSVVPLRMPAAPMTAILTTRVQPAAWWEQVLVTLWILTTLVQFQNDTLILYPCALVLVILFLKYAEFTIPLALKSAVLLSLPVLVTLSSGWTAAPPADTMRAGFLMIMNFVIMITIATRLTRREIVRCLFFAGIAMLVIIAPIWQVLHLDSQFGSKNLIAIRMLFILFASLAVAYDSEESYLLRFAAVPIAAIALLFTVLANSATATLLAIAGVGILTMAWMVWQPASRVRHLRSFVVIAGSLTLFIAVMILLSLPNNTMIDDILARFGKDSTLTNRTLMWEAGNRFAEQKPVFGHGYGSFWRPEVGAAQTLNELDHRAPGTKHSFHNTYIEVRVGLGFVGLTALIIQLAWAMSLNVRSWFQSRGMSASFFLLMGIVILITTFTESYMQGIFETMVLFYYLGGITAIAQKYHTGVRQRVVLRPA